MSSTHNWVSKNQFLSKIINVRGSENKKTGEVVNSDKDENMTDFSESTSTWVKLVGFYFWHLMI